MPAPKRSTKGRFTKAKPRGPVRQLWAFEYPYATRLRIKVVDSHPDYSEIIAVTQGRYIRFNEGRYATSNKYVARYLRELIKANAIRGLKEDISMYPIKCQFCEDFSLPDGGELNKLKMMDHLYEVHMEDPAFGGEDEAALIEDEDEE